MTGEIFAAQVKRLQGRFGMKAFDQQFVDLVWRECREMTDGAFITFVDVIIGSRPHTRPPLLTEFREAKLTDSNSRVRQEKVASGNRVACNDCKDSGDLFVERLPSFEEWAKWKTGVIRCGCQAGLAKHPNQGPIWGPAIAKSYRKSLGAI